MLSFKEWLAESSTQKFSQAKASKILKIHGDLMSTLMKEEYPVFHCTRPYDLKIDVQSKDFIQMLIHEFNNGNDDWFEISAKVGKTSCVFYMRIFEKGIAYKISSQGNNHGLVSILNACMKRAKAEEDYKLSFTEYYIEI